jgi:DNA primase
MPEQPARICTAFLDELRARTPLAFLVGRRVRLRRSGKLWMGLCPFHNEKSPSFYVYENGYHCFGCGLHGDAIDFVIHTQALGFQEAVRFLSAEAGMEAPLPHDCPSDAPRNVEPTEQPAPALPAGENYELARGLFKEALAPQGTLVETYLRFRGSQLPRSGAIRFHPACPRGSGERLPAMLAAMTCPVANRFVGVHRTFLRLDGMGKVEHGKAKMMLGNAGVIRLAFDDEITTGLGICEGIETGLSLMQRAGWTAIWAAGSAPAIAKFPVLGGIECLTIFPDADDSGVGRKAAEACTARWNDAGREVQTIWPPGGKDWNDCLARSAA